MTAATSPPPDDLRCDGCGYDLRGAALEGRCPECGLAVADSIRAAASRPPLLRDADPRRLRWVVLGAWLPLIHAAVTLLTWLRFIEFSGRLGRDALGLGSLGLACLGGALLFVRVPESEARQIKLARRWLLWVYILAAAIYLASIAVLNTPFWPGGNGGVLRLICFHTPMAATSCVGYLRLATLSARLPARRLRVACLLMASLSLVPLAESILETIADPNKYVGGQNAPFLLDTWLPAMAVQTVVANFQNGFYNGSPVAMVQPIFWLAGVHSWAAGVVVAPMAVSVVTWFAVRVTRAWLVARRRRGPL